MKVHVSKVGTYHPDPKQDVAWTINDTRGYIDAGPSCDDCAACDCEDKTHDHGDDCGPYDDEESQGCIGLSFAFVCLDGGDSLCEACAKKEGIEIVPCDCE